MIRIVPKIHFHCELQFQAGAQIVDEKLILPAFLICGFGECRSQLWGEGGPSHADRIFDAENSHHFKKPNDVLPVSALHFEAFQHHK